jgi:hypothetical protein
MLLEVALEAVPQAHQGQLDLVDLVGHRVLAEYLELLELVEYRA